ncbi:MAG TPA: hypothetical protein VHM90_21730 [Phycisphaerae bacterium]|nr:hypothetical protein [Phycisphaerae bacterium]
MTTGTPETAGRTTGADEINRLHGEAVRLAAASRETLNGALVAAWNAGRLLTAEKRNVRRAMGAGAWQLWLARYFTGTPRTAQRYMLLARSVADTSFLKGMSLRQAYFRLGIATEPKAPGRTVALRPVPRHAVLASRLLGILKPRTRLPPDVQKAYQQDLRPLYERLRCLFEPVSQ